MKRRAHKEPSNEVGDATPSQKNSILHSNTGIENHPERKRTAVHHKTM